MHLELTQDEWFMKVALREAYKAKGKTLPNPAVGAVVVKNGKVISTGYHERVGLPHAERVALEKAGKEAEGSTLYVTLEPCNHYGKTPPCTEKIIESKVKRVVIGVRDPNPIASGGIERLREAGIEVEVGVLERECLELIDDFILNLKEDRPFISLKLALSLDGSIADRRGTSKWITGKEARTFVHKLRSYHSAVMVGIETVLKDNPLLNVREWEVKSQPKVVVIDGKLRIPLHSKLITERAKDLILITAQPSLLGYKAKILEELGVNLVPVFGMDGSLDLKSAFKTLKKEYSIYSLFCEGGGKLASSLLKGELIDKLYLFYAPKILGSASVPSFPLDVPSIDKAFSFDFWNSLTFGQDVLLVYYSKFFPFSSENFKESSP